MLSPSPHWIRSLALLENFVAGFGGLVQRDFC